MYLNTNVFSVSQVVCKPTMQVNKALPICFFGAQPMRSKTGKPLPKLSNSIMYYIFLFKGIPIKAKTNVQNKAGLPRTDLFIIRFVIYFAVWTILCVYVMFIGNTNSRFNKTGVPNENENIHNNSNIRTSQLHVIILYVPQAKLGTANGANRIHCEEVLTNAVKIDSSHFAWWSNTLQRPKYQLKVILGWHG